MTLPNPPSSILVPAVAPAPGYRQVQALAEPGAGAGLSYVVPGGRLLRILSLVFSLTTSSTVGGRVVSVELTDADGNLLFITTDVSGQAASLTHAYVVSPDLSAGLAQQGGNHFLTFLHSYLDAGWIIKIMVSGEQAADQISAITLLTETLPVGQGGLERIVS